MSEKLHFSNDGNPWGHDTVEEFHHVAEQRIRAKNAKGQAIRCEDVIKDSPTLDGYDRRGLGGVVSRVMRDLGAFKAGTSQSGNPRHHGGNKVIWLIIQAPYCPACGRSLGGAE